MLKECAGEEYKSEGETETELIIICVLAVQCSHWHTESPLSAAFAHTPTAQQTGSLVSVHTWTHLLSMYTHIIRQCENLFTFQQQPGPM